MKQLIGNNFLSFFFQTTSISFLHIIASLSRICHGSSAQSDELSPASQTLDSGLTWSDEEGIDDLKKATLLNLLRVMGETRMLEHEVPIVFNRESELFQSYLEQRERSPRKVDYPPSGSGDEVNTRSGLKFLFCLGFL